MAYKGKDSRIDVTGISELALLAELHNHATISSNDTHYTGDICGDIDMQEAATGYTVEEPHFPEFLFGRPIRVSIKRENSRTFLIRCDLYDRDAGTGAVLDAIKAAIKYRDILT